MLYTTLVEHTSGCGAVDSALGLGPRGRRFESFHPDHRKSLALMPGFFYGPRRLKPSTFCGTQKLVEGLVQRSATKKCLHFFVNKRRSKFICDVLSRLCLQITPFCLITICVALLGITDKQERETMPFKAIGYHVSYQAGAFAERAGSFTSYRLGRAINNARTYFMESDGHQYMMVLNEPPGASNKQPSSLELMFFVPDSPERRAHLLKAIDDFERIVQSALGDPVNTEFRTIEPEEVPKSRTIITGPYDPPGEPDEFQYPIPGPN